MKLSFWEMGTLYYRDNAHKLKRASIDRIDNDGDYTFENCRFIEASLNAGLGRKGTTQSSEARKKIGEASRGNTYRRGKRGYKHTVDARHKISNSLKGNQRARKLR